MKFSLLLGLGAVSAVSAGLSACEGSEATVASDAKLPSGLRAVALDHEPCNEAGNKVELLDTNNDGKPDIRRVFDKSTNKEVCRISDLNHDGKPEMFEYFGKDGQLRRREADYDDSGVVDSIEYFENGKLVKRELDTSGEHRLDTWDYFDAATGKRTKRERDSLHTGRIDQWWTWEGDKVTIAFDKNGDGRPDPENTVILGGSPGTPDASVALTAGDAGPPPSTASTLSLDAGASLPSSVEAVPMLSPDAGGNASKVGGKKK